MDNREEMRPVQPGSGVHYTIDELLALMKPQYQEDQNTTRQCIAGLTEYAAQLAAKHQEEQIPQQTAPGGEGLSVDSCINALTTYAASFAVSGQEDMVLWLHKLIEDMTEFWGLDSPEQYLTTFKQTVLGARSSGQAAGLNEQNKKAILAGLERYIDEMSANDECQEPWFLECAGFIQKLREQWQLISEQKTGKPDCVLIGEDGNIFNLSGIAARTLHENGLHEQAEELQKRIFDGTCSDYCDALRVISEYVNITEPEGYSMEIGGM